MPAHWSTTSLAKLNLAGTFWRPHGTDVSFLTLMWSGQLGTSVPLKVQSCSNFRSQRMVRSVKDRGVTGRSFLSRLLYSSSAAWGDSNDLTYERIHALHLSLSPSGIPLSKSTSAACLYCKHPIPCIIDPVVLKIQWMVDYTALLNNWLLLIAAGQYVPIHFHITI